MIKIELTKKEAKELLEELEYGVDVREGSVLHKIREELKNGR